MRQIDYTRGENTPPPLVGPGESIVKNAPVLRLQAGQNCIPQHFLRYAHSVETVEAIVAQIEYDPRYPIFVSADTGGLYIQIGIVGPDNYKTGRDKLVYGRKWRVEPNLPTSEIIQTVFLAIKKAREHELRERFALLYDGRKTTPFNGHQDLPHMSRNPACFAGQTERVSPRTIIENVVYDGTKFNLDNITVLPTEQAVLCVSPKRTSESEFAKLCNDGLSFICDSLSPLDVLHGFFEACLKTSDQHVEEYFRYSEFARFSRNVNVFKIAKLSSKQRQCPTAYLPENEASQFIGQLKFENYETDETRIPVLIDTIYNRKTCKQLTAAGVSPPPIG